MVNLNNNQTIYQFCHWMGTVDKMSQIEYGFIKIFIAGGQLINNPFDLREKYIDINHCFPKHRRKIKKHELFTKMTIILKLAM